MSAAPISHPYPPNTNPPPLNPSLLLFLCTLAFSAPYSKPVVTLASESNLRPGDEVALTCVAYGGYPEAGVIWQDGGSRNLTDNITTSLVANEEGLFTITSVLTVVLEPNSTYSCGLINPLLGEEGYAFVTITGGSSSLFLHKQLLCLSVSVVSSILVQSKQANILLLPAVFECYQLRLILFSVMRKQSFLLKSGMLL